MGDGAASKQPAAAGVWILAIATELVDGVRVISVSGRIARAACPVLRGAIDHEMNAPPARMLLDLERVDYVSSAGLRLLADAVSRVRASGGEVALCCLSDPVRLAIELAGLATAFTIEPSRRGGIARLRA